MEDFLREIYKFGIVLDELNTFTDRLYADSVMPVYSKQVLDETIPILVEACQALVSTNDISGQIMYEALGRLSNYTSGIQIADELSLNVIPNLKRYIGSLPKIDVDDDNGIRIKSSSVGLLTLIDTSNDAPLHSVINPMSEAKKKAELLYNPLIGNYIFFGCGLGYLPYQLYLISDKSVHITVFFSSISSYEYANSYGVLDYIDEKDIDIVNPDNIDSVREFIKAISKEKTEYYVFRNELKYLSLADYETMDVFISRQDTLFNASPYINNNFPCNIRNVNKFVSEYIRTKIKKKIAVVAGGPSVDDNIEYLKNNRLEISIVCVGTIYNRLLKEGIVPDIVTIIDPFPTTVPQVIDTIETETALFIGMDAYWKVADLYPGDKYLLAMEDDIGNQMEYANRFNEHVFPNCSTVTTMAYYIASYLDAEEIMLIGADYAYPNGTTHASGTNENSLVNTENMISIENVKGEAVYSTQKMLDYKSELEDAIISCGIRTYNLSNVGAKIKGTR